jgi:hypothetical protein
MELSNLYTLEEHEEGAEVQIKNPSTEQLTDFYITVRGPDSRAYRTALRAYHRSILENKEGGDVAMLVAVTKDWRGLKDNGKEIKCSEKSAKDLYTNAPAVATQVDQFVSNRKNFTKG